MTVTMMWKVRGRGRQRGRARGAAAIQGRGRARGRARGRGRAGAISEEDSRRAAELTAARNAEMQVRQSLINTESMPQFDTWI